MNLRNKKIFCSVLLCYLLTLISASDNEQQLQAFRANDQPKPNQKSLVFIFDGTSSMTRDLEQLRTAAKQIVNELSLREDNPIFNYILVIFRDPGMLTKLTKIYESLRSFDL